MNSTIMPTFSKAMNTNLHYLTLQDFGEIQFEKN